MGGNVRDAFKGSDRTRSCSTGRPSETPSGQSVESQRARSSGSYSSVDSGTDDRLYCPYCGDRGPLEGDNYCAQCGEELTGVF